MLPFEGRRAGSASASPPRDRVVATFSRGIARIPDISALIGAERVVLWPMGRDAREVGSVVGWGMKPTAALPAAFARRRRLPFVRLEDGFLRSVGLGVDGAAPLSIVADDLGIHYDATRPSRLEHMLEAEGDDLESLAPRARRCIDRIVASRLSKYNHAPVVKLPAPRAGCRGRVLVVDQIRGDLSIRYGLPRPGGFRAMLEAALSENPSAEIVVKAHPDVLGGKRKSAMGAALTDPRVRVVAQRANPIALLEQVDRVYVMTSLLGFEALMVGLPVTCFGAPFYAGWGLTDDRVPCPRRTRRRRIEDVFAAAYLRYSRYVDPETGERCEIERLIEHLALQREKAEPDPRPLVCVGFSPWKRGFVPSFLGAPGRDVRMHRSGRAAAPDAVGAQAIVAWGAEPAEEIVTLARRSGAPLWRMEDGFLRSVGLGRGLVPPLSLVIDREGMYFDPSRPSELELLLEHGELDDAEIARARALRERLVARGLSKYNVGSALGRDLRREAQGRSVVLVVGQVETDASIRLGCPRVRTNLGLLAAARAAKPEAFLVYKPHPDVAVGFRKGIAPAREVARLADAVIVDASIHDCLGQADELHTLTSLAGFEALLRGVRVVTHGQPFYAGWGLTEDLVPVARRTRRRTLDELVAATLIRYPVYVHPRSRAFTTPEAVVELLGSDVASHGRSPVRFAPFLVRELEPVRNYLRSIRRGP